MKKIAVIGVPGGWSSELLADTVERKTGFRCLADIESLILDLESGRVFNQEVELGDMDAILIKKAGPLYSPLLLDRLEMLRFLADKGVRIFSDPLRVIRVLDRMSCTVTLKLGGIPMPATAITENEELALRFIETHGKVILKPLYSTKARGMVVVASGPEAREAIRTFKAEHQMLYLQQLVEHPGKDLGVTFLGGKYLATYARAGKSDSWNTTTLSGGKYEPFEPSPEIIALAQKAQDLFQLDFTCVDVVETPDGPKIFEVSAFGGFRGLRDANGIDAADLFVDYALARIQA